MATWTGFLFIFFSNRQASSSRGKSNWNWLGFLSFVFILRQCVIHNSWSKLTCATDTKSLGTTSCIYSTFVWAFFTRTKCIISLKLFSKEWELEKETKVNSKILLIKSSGIIFVFSPAFYLIILPMTHQRNSLKIHLVPA